ncbi:hypothetical protein HK100_003538, partial [Physocladia obscura]
TLLGYRIHISIGANGSNGGVDVVPFSAISKLIAQGNIALTDNVLIRILGKYTNQIIVDRLLRFVPRAKMIQIGENLLTECFEQKMLNEAVASGYISRPIQRAEILVKIFGLDKDTIARAFMGTPRDWDTWIPPTAPHATCTHARQPQINKGDGLFQYDLGMLTRQGQASGGLPWVSWQWAVQHLGAAHPVASACLHDCAVRSFQDQAPLNPGDHDAISFPRKEADASVKALLALGVGASMSTVGTAIRKALYEVEVAALSGEAAAVMRTQAAALKGRMGKMAAEVAAAASLAGANAISRRYVYVMMDIEKKLLSQGSDEFPLSPPTVSISVGGVGGVVGSSTKSIATTNDSGSASSSGDNVKSLKSGKPGGGTTTTTVSAAGLSIQTGEVLNQQIIIEVPVENGEETVMVKKVVSLYPQGLLRQSRQMWLAAMKVLIADNNTWKDMSNSPVAPNACRRFCLAAANIVRGLEQFGMPASALAVLKSKKGTSKAVKSMSSSDSENTMFFGLWCKEIEEEDAEKDRTRRGLK